MSEELRGIADELERLARRLRGSGSAVGSEGHAAVLAEAREWLGVPYVYGGQGPTGVDCSGLVLEVYRRAGQPIVGDTTAQGLRGFGHQVAWGQVHDGDLLFFDLEGLGEATHVGIRTAFRRMIHAPQPGDVVREVDVTEWWREQCLEARCYF